MVDSVILYLTALCNLKCEYCFICKNKGLEIVDKDIEESFKDPNYYFNLYSKCESNIDFSRLRAIELFGGEPLLKIERVLPTLETFINNCPNLRTIVCFSNFSHENTYNAVKQLSEFLNKFAPRKFEIDLQLSWDGPDDLNDDQRGKGTAQKIVNNFDKLLEADFFATDTVHPYLHIKPTLNPKNLYKFLDDKYLRAYYQYFEDEYFSKLNAAAAKNPNIPTKHMWYATISSPWDTTVEDGKLVAKICKKLNDLNIENETTHQFPNAGIFNWFYKEFIKWNGPVMTHTFCPFGHSEIILLPHNKYGACKRGFANYCDTYIEEFNLDLFKKEDIINSNVTQDFVYNNVEELHQFQNRIKAYYNDVPHCDGKNEYTHIIYYVNAIQWLAKAGQILEKYSDLTEATKAAIQISKYNSMCAYHNIVSQGCELFASVSTLKLWLNGVLDELERTYKLINEGVIVTKWATEKKITM